ncbi:MAG TPA: hypothetical protein VGY99_02475 [Candidatus Binataceae bacterium]|nr:hypothetical protein [Candidatus Binataceae bacterium]
MAQRRGSGRLDGIIKFAAGVVVGTTLSCALASAAQIVRHDGVFWKALGNKAKTAYVAGYSDASRASLGKLDQLKVAAGLFRWKGADKILNQVARGLDASDLPPHDLVAYLDNVYSNSRYGDFDVANAIELAAMRGAGAKSDAQTASTAVPATPSSSR